MCEFEKIRATHVAMEMMPLDRVSVNMCVLWSATTAAFEDFVEV